MTDENKPDPLRMTLEEWKRIHGTRTGTYTYNAVKYTDMNEVDWRRVNNEWRR